MVEESVLRGDWTFTSPSVYMVLNAVTMGYGCYWPQFSTQRDIIITMKPGVLGSLAVDNTSKGAVPRQKSFNFLDLQPPVPASAYFGVNFYNGDWKDNGQRPAEAGVIIEGIYQPRVIINQAIWEKNPLYESCRPFVGEYEGKELAAWDPVIILPGAPVTTLPGRTLIKTQSASPLPVISDGSPLQTKQSTPAPQPLPSQQPQGIADTPVNGQVPVVQASPTATARDKPPPAPTSEPIVFLPPRQGEPESQHVIAIGKTTTVLIAAGPAVTIGTRIISMDRGGLVYEQVQTQVPLSQAPFIAPGRSSASSLPTRSPGTGSLAAVGVVSTKINNDGSLEVTYMVDPRGTEDSSKVTVTTASAGIRRFGFIGLCRAWAPSVFALVLVIF
jgi:hypothetical protein